LSKTHPASRHLRKDKTKPLTGTGILAVGIRYGRFLDSVSFLADAGARIALIDIGDDYGDLPEDETADAIQRLLTRPDGFVTMSAAYEDLHEGTADLRNRMKLRALLRRVAVGFGRIDVVYLGWMPWLPGGPFIPDLLEIAGALGVRELILTEGQEPAEEVTRWTTIWAESHPEVQITVLREPLSRPPNCRIRAATVAAQLMRHGWKRFTLLDANRQARRRIAAGDDALAGQMWRCKWTLGRCDRWVAIGDARAAQMIPFQRIHLVECLDGDILLPDRLSAPFVVAYTPEDFSYSVEVAPQVGRPRAVRIAFDSDSFESPEAFERVAEMELSGAGLWVGHPLGDGPDATLRVARGQWVLEVLRTDSWVVALRARDQSWRPSPGK